MKILIVNNTQIPAAKYGGTERVIWWLGKELNRLGHEITYLVAPGSECPFAKVLVYDPTVDMNQQVPGDVDVVHFHFQVNGFTKKPYLINVHNNPGYGQFLDKNSVFVSADHATRHGSSVFVHHGLDPDDYPRPDLKKDRTHTHFLAKAAWRVKNVKGAIDVATKSGNKLIVLGGSRLNLKMGLRFTWHLNVRFKGMVDNVQKSTVLNSSKALLFPVLWNEPFGLAIIESLYFGCPVFGTPYGSLPELVSPDVGLLSNSRQVLSNGLKAVGQFNTQLCHDYAVDNFTVQKMAQKYLMLYQEVLNGKTLNAVNPTLLETAPKYLPWNG
ncbi:glycosyltransferase [Mucilaginibacter pocheonensis]|uniref:Glycosyltransferase involved in cell wall biosynthesis n=1 Tax=Mucilaginibacter pocheonensis TaxID=398050 RepID=A0ABU1TB76_9SPHI|nr:glycosyltransferase [Mucilaginibacter pocheonensis]MDR6942636.1 glycosyltransferase involved in cell wall biosynthesis [Mucilaginibacter pocheonensis]